MIDKKEDAVILGSLLAIAILLLFKLYNSSKKNNRLPPQLVLQLPNYMGDIDNLPSDIQPGILKFFNQKDWSKVASVNKHFRALSISNKNHLKITHVKNIYFTVGNYVPAVDFELVEFFGVPVARDIPFSDIYNAFCGKNITTLNLFKTKEEASRYADCTQRESTNFLGTYMIEETPVYEVIFLGDPELLQQEKITVEAQAFEIFKTTRLSVIPMQAFIRKQCYDCNDWQQHPHPENNLNTLTTKNT